MSSIREWQDFGQRVDLTANIRKILLDYPEGTSIFKELIQNADDAGARTISFCLDARTHGSESLAYGGLASLQGPALLVRNDATFSDGDFESISSVGNSVKRAQSGKTGRYGIGFNAVYHLTDVPSFVSGRHLAIFDPHCKFLPGLAAENPGKRIDFVANPVADNFPDQFDPYKAFGCDMRSHFDGTLFRFPLRSEALAADSRISKQVYTADKMRAQLDSLASEAAALLLFLRSVERCEILVWAPGESEPQLLHECCIQDITPELRRQRALFQGAAAAVGTSGSGAGGNAVLSVHRMTLASTDHTLNPTTSGGGKPRSRSQTFLVGQSNGGGSDGPMAEFAEEVGKLFGAPWGGVACPMSPADTEEGRAYCFLPLPVATGLPAVHVNGMFSLSTNRRDIWHGDDMTGDGARRSKWNLRLLEGVIAPLYAHVLAEAARMLGPGRAYNCLWPSKALHAPWDRLLEGFYAAIVDEAVVLSAARGGPRWLTPRQVVFADAMASRSEELMAALASVGTPLSGLGAAPTQLLLQALPCAPRLLTPAWLRGHLQGAAARNAQTSAALVAAATAVGTTQGLGLDVSAAGACALLLYCVADLDDTDPDMVAQLAGLPLVPMQSGGLGTLQADGGGGKESGGGRNDDNGGGGGGAGGRMFLAAKEDEVLLAAVPQLVLDQAAAGPELTARLRAIASLGVLNLRPLSCEELPALLPALLPAAWAGAEAAPWTPGEGGHPSEAWLQRLWARLQEAPDLAPLAGWPLLPLRGGGLSALLPAVRSAVLRPAPEWPPHLLDALEALGCRLLRTKLPLQHPKLSSYVHAGSGAGVLAALRVALGDGSAEVVFDRHGITPCQRRALRQLLLQERWLGSGSGSTSAGAPALQRRHTLQRLPIFEPAAAATAAAGAAPTDEAAAGTSATTAVAPGEAPAAAQTTAAAAAASAGAGSREQPEGVFMDLLGERFTAPGDIAAAALPQAFVAAAGEAERAVLELLGVHRLSLAEVHRQHLFPQLGRLPPALRDEVMLAAVRRLPQLASVLGAMRGLAFVSTESGELRPPSALHDPRVPELAGLLDARTAFPTGAWAEDSVLAALSTLGLQTVVTPAALLDAARRVEAISTSDPDTASTRGKALLAYLDVEAGRLALTPAAAPASPTQSAAGGGGGSPLNRLFSRVGTTLGQALLRPEGGSSGSGAGSPAEMAAQGLRARLAVINWCPVLTSPPDGLVPWPAGALAPVAAPQDVRPPSDLALASATKRILDGECRSAALSEGLGWGGPPDAATLAAQLRALGLKHAGGPGCGGGDGRSELSADKRRGLAVAVPRLLQALSNVPDQQMQEVAEALQGAPVIWTGAGFTAIDRVAFSGPLSLDPWLYVTPLELAPFAPLLRRLGVRDGFSAEQYAAVLAAMAEESGNEKLNEKSLAQALSIVQALSGLDCGGKQLFVPDERGRLAPAEQLVFNDAPWLETTGPAAARTVHPKISNEVADGVGVGSLRRRLLAAGADNFRLEAAEAFGQSEALTTRLKHITDDYADGPGVLLELVQNADDAGASEVAFMLDGRSYPTDSVLGPGMAAWQGPALCCYNDAVFSPADLRNISRIGQDSKLDKPAATGRFGLGWNAVYHFTDVPSFCSGENIVLFDPHAKYLPGISASQPGLRIGFERAGLLAQFPDAVSPYLHFGCTLRRHFPGTFFRFPLRTEALAAASEIKQTAFSPADVMALFGAFQKQAADTLLFLKYVRTLSVYSSDGSSEEPRLLFRFRLTVPQGQAYPQEPIMRAMRNTDREALLRRLALAPPGDLPAGCGQVAIAEEDAAGPVGQPRRWLVYNALAGGGPLRLAAEACKDSRGLTPWVGVAAPLPASGDAAGAAAATAADALAADGGADGEQGAADDGIAAAHRAGRAFVFLPLPLATGLPVHVNGCFELSSNRRELWLGTDMARASARRAAWNEALLREGVAAVYARTLLRAAQVLGPKPAYYALWPAGQLAAPWSGLADALYAELAPLPVVWTRAGGGRWLPPSEAVLPDEACRADENLLAALLAAGLPLADPVLPPPAADMLLAQAPGARALHPALLRRHLSAPGWRFAGNDAAARAAAPLLLEQCMADVLDDDPASVALLAGLPLLPLADGRRGTLRLAADAGPAGVLYMANDEDVSLLGGSQGHLLVHFPDASALAGRLMAVAATGALSLRPLTAEALADVFLPAILPAAWRGAVEVEWTEGTAGQPTAAALASLWRRISAFPAAESQRFRSLPLVPVSGGRLTAPARLPVVAPGSWAGGVSSALRKLGCRLLDASALPEDATEVYQFVHPASGAGLLAAISETAAAGTAAAAAAAEGARAERDAAAPAAGGFASAGLEPAERTQLREFLLQERWFSQGSGITAAASAALKQLPIFPSGPPLPPPPAADADAAGPAAPQPAPQQQPAGSDGVTGQHFVDLASRPRRLPPPNTPPALLSDGFVVTASAEEAAILAGRLGVPLLGQHEFVETHLLPHAAALPAGPRDRAVASVLRALHELPETLQAKLPTVAFVSTAYGALLAPRQLFDPRNGELAALLDAGKLFPGPVFASDNQVLAALATLGMRTRVSLEALVDVARQLEAAAAEAATVAVAMPAAELDAMLRRARALLEQLDRFAQHEGDESHAEMWMALTRLVWCPVLVAPPLPGLPWTTASQTRAAAVPAAAGGGGDSGAAQRLPPLAAPRLARPPADLWLVSAAVRVVDMPEGRQPSPALMHKLGWAAPPSPNVLAVQLLELGRLHPRVGSAETAALLEGVADRLYQTLGRAMDDSASREVVRATLEDGAWVWVGDGFVTAAQAALRDASGSTPCLRIVSPAIAAKHRDTLLALGVQDEPGATQVAHALRHIAAEAAGAPLSDAQLAAVGALADLLASHVLRGGTSQQLHIVLPDAEAVMVPAESLFVNDADWLPAGAARLVHRGIKVQTAEALGAQSLRFHHQVSTDHTQQLPCPAASSLAAALASQRTRGVEALFDIAEVAEAAGASRMDVWLDARRHPAQSLLQPGLAEFQGPAVCVSIPGVYLSEKELCDLQLPPQPFHLRGRACGAGAGLMAAYALTDLPMNATAGDSLHMWDPIGSSLAMAARASATGSAASASAAPPEAVPQARKYKFTGTELPTHFAHQFAPWGFAGRDVSGGVEGTLLRLALRTNAQAASGAISHASWSVDAASQLLDSFIAAVAPALLFLQHLRAVRVMRWDVDADAPACMAQVAVSSRVPDQKHVFKESRRSGLASLGDRLRNSRTGKTRAAWLDCAVQKGDEAAVQQQWLVAGCVGAGRSAEAAADARLAAQHAVPAAGVAVRLLSQRGRLKVEPAPGLSALLPVGGVAAPNPALASDGGQPSGLAAMPFHIGGHFLLRRTSGRHLDWQGTSPEDPAARFNLELLACVCGAWGEAFKTLLELGADNLYALIPPAAALATAEGSGAGFALAQKICQDAAAKPIWRLRSSRRTAAAPDMGQAALDWLHRRAPLHEAPAAVKEDLEAAGISGLASVTPASVRAMLKRAYGRRGDNAGAVTAGEAAALLRFCFADLYDASAPADGAGTAPPHDQGGPQVGLAAGLDVEVAAAVAAVQRGVAHTLVAAQGLWAEAQAAATGGGLPALGNWAARRADGGAEAGAGQADAADGTAVAAAAGRYVAERVRDCVGLPVPTGGGTVIPLGSKRLFAWPPGMRPTPLEVLPAASSGLAEQFLHPDVVAHLGHHFAAAVIGSALQVQSYELASAERHLPALLPPHWAPRPPLRSLLAARPPPPAMPVPWHPGQKAPSQAQLQALWAMLAQLLQNGGGTPPQGWDALGEWALLPLSAGGVFRMCHRSLVFTPPPPTPPAPASGAEAAIQPGQPAVPATAAPNASPSNGAAAGTQQPGMPAANGVTAADTLTLGIGALQLEAPLDSAAAAAAGAAAAGAAADAGAAASGGVAAGAASPAESMSVDSGSGDDDMASAASEDLAAAAAAAATAAPARMDGATEGQQQEATRQQEAVPQEAQQSHPEAQLWEWLTPLLLRLGLPVLHPAFPAAAAACRPPGASPTEPTEDVVLHKLRLCADAGLLQADAMRHEDRSRLLLYFAECVPGGLEADDASFLLRLPIFPGVTHSPQNPAWRPLTGGAAGGGAAGDAHMAQDAAVCPAEVLDAVCSGWAGLPANLQARLLQHNPALAPLYERLSVPEWSAAQLLAHLLLPAFEALAPGTQQSLLAYVERRWAALRGDDMLKEALAATPFVDTGVEGALAQPDELFDPRTQLLALVFAGQPVFPAGRFATGAWLQVLREVGMKGEVDADTFRLCAQRVAESYAAAPDSHAPEAAAGAAMKAAEMLAAHLAAKADDLFAPHLFHMLGAIAFVPATQATPGQAVGARILTSFAQAAAPSDWALTWGAAPIVEERCVPPNFAWSPLRLRSPPVLSTVMAHLQAVGADGGEAALAAWPAAGPAPEAAFAAVAKHLTNQGLSPEQAAQLSGVPLVPVAAGSRLIAAGRLFARLPQDLAPFAYEPADFGGAPLARLSQDLAPFAYELPAEHLRWDALLRSLGMRDAPGPSGLLVLLADVSDASNGAPLNANERRAALRLLAALCDDADAAQVKATREAAARGRVHVLSADGRLVPAAGCVHIRTAGRALLQRVDGRRLALAHPKLGPEVAALLRIPPLEEIVHEVLDSFGAAPDLESIQGVALAAVQERLSLPAFAAAVADVLRCCADALPTLKGITRQEVAGKLEAVGGRLRFVEHCFTRIVRRADASDAGGAQEVPFFVDTESGEAVMAAPPPGVPPLAVLSAALSAALGSPLPLPLEALLAAPAAELPSVAAAVSPGGMGSVSGGLDVEQLAKAGEPGTALLPADAACVQLRPLRPFCAGELCAFQPFSAAAAPGGGGGQPRLVYGRVTADARPAAGQAVHRVPLEVDPGQYAELLSTKVWCFTSSAGRGEGGGADDYRLAATTPAAAAVAADWAPTSASGNGGSAPGAGAVGAIGAAHTTGVASAAGGSSTSGVSAAEAAAAVAEMLTAAGLPAGAENGALLREALHLREERDELKTRADTLQQELAVAADAAESASAAWQCRICLGADVDAAMKECGHTLCRACAAASAPGRCPFCRKPSGVLRLFNG